MFRLLLEIYLRHVCWLARDARWRPQRSNCRKRENFQNRALHHQESGWVVIPFVGEVPASDWLNRGRFRRVQQGS